MKTIKIFEYGPLMKKDSLITSYSSITNISPCKLFGFVRVFNFPSSSMISEINQAPCAVLNLDKSDLNHEVCGIFFEITEEDFKNIFKREEEFELVQVEVEDFKNSNSRSKAYTFRALHFEAHNFQFNSEKQLEYLNQYIQEAKEYGKEFFDSVLKTTYIGNQTVSELLKNKELNLD